MSKLTVFVKASLTSSALCLCLALAVPAYAKNNHQHTPDVIRQMLSKLSLNEIQKQDIKQIYQESRQNKDVFRTDAKSFRQKIQRLVQTNEWDQAAVESALASHQTVINDNALQRAVKNNRIWNLLTETQQAELLSQLEVRKGKRGSNKQRRVRVGKILKRLDLTDKQTAAVKAIKSAAKDNIETSKSKIKTYKQAERTLIQRTNFNHEAWQTLNAQYQSDFMTMALLKIQTKHDVWNLFTTGQQNKAKKLVNARKNKQG